MKYIDLFSGISGFGIAMEKLGHECVFASEIDPFARKTYSANFDTTGYTFDGDITKVNPNDIPDFDILCAGFPCQAFSNIGHRQGFNTARGTLFFNVAEILKVKQPQYFILENVRGLLSHDNGKTFATIREILTNVLGYSLNVAVLKVSEYGLPQLRPRVYMVGSRDHIPFVFPETVPLKFNMSDVMGGKCDREIGFTLRVGGSGSGVADRRNWDHYLVDGVEEKISIDQMKMIQGFPENYTFPVSNTQARKQLGNSVSPVVIEAIARNLRSEATDRISDT